MKYIGIFSLVRRTRLIECPWRKGGSRRDGLAHLVSTAKRFEIRFKVLTQIVLNSDEPKKARRISKEGSAFLRKAAGTQAHLVSTAKRFEIRFKVLTQIVLNSDEPKKATKKSDTFFDLHSHFFNKLTKNGEPNQY